MKYVIFTLFLLCFFPTLSFTQLRDYRIHSRGMLHQTVYNTGELGRQYDNGTAGMLKDYPSLEWPPNGYQIIDRTIYSGYHNSFGAGLWIAGKRTRTGTQRYMYCGALSDANGYSVTIENVYSVPISIERYENYPVLSDGTVNYSYNPDEAEEIIVSKWKTLDTLGVTVTRTSRAWSFPGYDSFIIYEYELENTIADTISDAFVAFPYGFCPSMFGMQRKYNRWAEADTRASDYFARFDQKRYMTYNHSRDGSPDIIDFDLWSAAGNRGGLNSPEAVGLMMLHYDYDHLAIKGQTILSVTGSDTVSWDENNKIKQPFLNRYENGNLYPNKVQLWLDPNQQRKTRPFRLTDTLLYALMNNDRYWLGRARPSTDLGNAQPAGHGYGFGPYTLPPHEKMRFTVAEVIGYGPGVASDSVYLDFGGGIRYIDAEPFLNPVPNWYNMMTYAGLGSGNYIGSNYLQTHSLPWYVTPGVVSIRDVADRAIQMYTGRDLIKYDTLQFEPETTPGIGVYNTIAIPFPSPIISVHTTSDSLYSNYRNIISWNAQVESFSAPRLRAPLSHYRIIRASDPLGPWALLDSVAKGDTRFFHDSLYTVDDTICSLGQYIYYAVYSVDTLGGQSGMTNMVGHETVTGVDETTNNVPHRFQLEQNYPNPFNPSTTINYEIPKQSHVTLKVFDVIGREIATLVNGVEEPGYKSVTFDASRLSSGVYYYRMQAGNFVDTKKLLLLR